MATKQELEKEVKRLYTNVNAKNKELAERKKTEKIFAIVKIIGSMILLMVLSYGLILKLT